MLLPSPFRRFPPTCACCSTRCQSLQTLSVATLSRRLRGLARRRSRSPGIVFQTWHGLAGGRVIHSTSSVCCFIDRADRTRKLPTGSHGWNLCCEIRLSARPGTNLERTLAAVKLDSYSANNQSMIHTPMRSSDWSEQHRNDEQPKGSCVGGFEFRI